MEDDIEIEETTGSVFEALGLEDAPELELKSALASMIRRRMREHKLTQKVIAQRTGIPQPEISLLVNFKLHGISVERLLFALTALGVDVRITLDARADAGEPGQLTLAVGAA